MISTGKQASKQKTRKKREKKKTFLFSKDSFETEQEENIQWKIENEQKKNCKWKWWHSFFFDPFLLYFFPLNIHSSKITWFRNFLMSVGCQKIPKWWWWWWKGKQQQLIIQYKWNFFFNKQILFIQSEIFFVHVDNYSFFSHWILHLLRFLFRLF